MSSDVTVEVMADTLAANFVTDDRLRHFRGARCKLPTGEVIEVSNRRTPLYDLARELEARAPRPSATTE